MVGPTSLSAPKAVAVGVDGSRESWHALHAAAWEARVRQAPMVLAHGYPTHYPYGWGPPLNAVGYDLKEVAADFLAGIADEARRQHPDLSITSDLRPGSGAQVLAEVSRDCALVVVGARGHGGFGGLSLGSVAAQTAAHASSPVMVIRPTEDDDAATPRRSEPDLDTPHPGPVLVGVDGSDHDERTLRFAFEAAELRDVTLVVVNVWSKLPEGNLGPDLPGHYDLDGARNEASRLLAEMVAGWAPRFPDVRVEQRAELSMNPSQVLIAESEHAGLVVVGSRGRGGFAGLLLGSVGRDLIGHAHAPVAVVPPARR